MADFGQGVTRLPAQPECVRRLQGIQQFIHVGVDTTDDDAGHRAQVPGFSAAFLPAQRPAQAGLKHALVRGLRKYQSDIDRHTLRGQPAKCLNARCGGRYLDQQIAAANHLYQAMDRSDGANCILHQRV